MSAVTLLTGYLTLVPVSVSLVFEVLLTWLAAGTILTRLAQWQTFAQCYHKFTTIGRHLWTACEHLQVRGDCSSFLPDCLTAALG